MTDPQTIIAFATFAERLKNVMRHSYTSAGKRESVAEHSWMLCLLALLVFDELETPVDRLRVLKMLIVHDLPEIITGDIPVFDKANMLQQAQAAEAQAIIQLTADLPPHLQSEIIALCHEFETRETTEAKLAYAIDKAEAIIQHNTADIATWDQNDFDYQTDLRHPRYEHFKFEPFMAALKQQLDRNTMSKIEAAGQLDRANQVSVSDYLAGAL